MIHLRNIIPGNYQLLKNIKNNNNGIALALEYARVGIRRWITYWKMDSPCFSSLHKIHYKVDGMFYETNTILGNYQLHKNIRTNYNGVALALEYA